MAKNGTTQAAPSRDAIDDQSMAELKSQILDTSVLFAGLIMTPLIFFLGAAYGVRAGIVVGLKKTIELLKAWNR